MTSINPSLVVMGVSLFCFASAAAIEIRRDRASLRPLVRILRIAIAAVASILFLSFRWRLFLGYFLAHQSDEAVKSEYRLLPSTAG